MRVPFPLLCSCGVRAGARIAGASVRVEAGSFGPGLQTQTDGAGAFHARQCERIVVEQDSGKPIARAFVSFSAKATHAWDGGTSGISRKGALPLVSGLAAPSGVRRMPR